MNTLIALGTGAAFLYSLAVTVAPGVVAPPQGGPRGHGAAVYYEVAVAIIVLVLRGAADGTRARGRTSEAIGGSSAFSPATHASCATASS